MLVESAYQTIDAYGPLILLSLSLSPSRFLRFRVIDSRSIPDVNKQGIQRQHQCYRMLP